jgi:hypothetical protein
MLLSGTQSEPLALQLLDTSLFGSKPSACLVARSVSMFWAPTSTRYRSYIYTLSAGELTASWPRHSLHRGGNNISWNI